MLSTADWVMLCAYFVAMGGMTFLAYRKQKGPARLSLLPETATEDRAIIRSGQLRRLLSGRSHDELGGGRFIPLRVEYRIRGELKQAD